MKEMLSCHPVPRITPHFSCIFSVESFVLSKEHFSKKDFTFLNVLIDTEFLKSYLFVGTWASHANLPSVPNLSTILSVCLQSLPHIESY